MIDLLAQILCWIKQIGAMFLSAGVLLVNLVLAAFVGLANLAIGAWPVGMPTLPAIPDELGVAMQWLKWSPLPINAMLAFFAFYVSVQIGWLVLRPLLRWVKVSD